MQQWDNHNLSRKPKARSPFWFASGYLMVALMIVVMGLTAIAVLNK